MRKVYFFIAAIFVIMAAALGWFLPLAAFNIDDKLSEGKQMELDIERVNLTYRDDLTITQKLEIVNNSQYEDVIQIDKGIFLHDYEVKVIVRDFLADFTGYVYDLDADSSDMYLYMAPVLVNLTNNRGTTIMWMVDFGINYGEWDFQCCIDDRTGAILQCSFDGYYSDWSALFNDYYDFDDTYEAICERYRNAIYNQWSKTINAKFVTYHLYEGAPEYGHETFVLIFRDEKNDTFDVKLHVNLDDYNVRTND